MIRRASIRSLALATLALAGCSTPPNAPSDGASPPAATLAPPAASNVPQGAASGSGPSGAASGLGVGATSADAANSTAPATSGPEPAPPATPTASASASASAAPAGPIPNVKVANIGMHIGGGPNDAPTKAPIKQSVEPRFDDLKRCFGLVDDQKKGGDFGLDLLIDKAGGKAKVSHPRTSLKGNGFKECMVAAFEAIDFKKPRGGTTTVSYSVRFTP